MRLNPIYFYDNIVRITFCSLMVVMLRYKPRKSRIFQKLSIFDLLIVTYRRLRARSLLLRKPSYILISMLPINFFRYLKCNSFIQGSENRTVLEFQVVLLLSCKDSLSVIDSPGLPDPQRGFIRNNR